MTEGNETRHMYLIETGILSLQTTVEKANVSVANIDKSLMPLFQKLKPLTHLQVFERGDLIRDRGSGVRVRNTVQ